MWSCWSRLGSSRSGRAIGSCLSWAYSSLCSGSSARCYRDAVRQGARSIFLRLLPRGNACPDRLALQPRDHERGVATGVAVAEAEAKLAPEKLCATPTDQRNLELVRERSDGDRVVGTVDTSDRDPALASTRWRNPVGRVLHRTLGKPILRVQHISDRTVDQSRAPHRIIPDTHRSDQKRACGCIDEVGLPPSIGRWRSLVWRISRLRCAILQRR